MPGGYKFLPANGRGQVHLGQISRSEAKRLRKLSARGSRGTARGRGREASSGGDERGRR